MTSFEFIVLNFVKEKIKLLESEKKEIQNILYKNLSDEKYLKEKLKEIRKEIQMFKLIKEELVAYNIIKKHKLQIRPLNGKINILIKDSFTVGEINKISNTLIEKIFI